MEKNMDLATTLSFYDTNSTEFDSVRGDLQRPLDQEELFVGYPPALMRFASMCCVVFILVGIPGNLITIVALARCKKVRNATAVFIMNLSLSDLLFCCINLPMSASTFWQRAWCHGEVMCWMFPLMRYGLVAVSLCSVLAITINRYVMIGHPRLYPKLYRRKFLGFMVACIWLFGFGALLPTGLGLWGHFGLDVRVGSCSILPDEKGRSPKEFLFIVAFLTPCLFIVVCYARIFYIVRKTAAKSRMHTTCSSKVPISISVGHTSKMITSLDEDHSTQLRSLKTDKSSAYESENVYDHSSVYPANSPNGIVSNNNRNFDCKSPEGSNNPDPHLLSPPKDSFRHVKPPERIEPENITVEPSSSSGIEIYMYDMENDVDNLSTISDSPSINSSARPAKKIGYKKRKGDTMSSSVGQVAAVLRRSTKKRNTPRRRSTVTTSGSSLSCPGKMSAKDKKLLKMILVIFLSFLACYLPITMTKITKYTNDFNVLNICVYLMIYLSTCINPIIYVVMSSEYRQAYKNLLMCRGYSPESDREVQLPLGGHSTQT